MIFHFFLGTFSSTRGSFAKTRQSRVLAKMKKFKNELFHFRGFTCPGVLRFLKNVVFQETCGKNTASGTFHFQSRLKFERGLGWTSVLKFEPWRPIGAKGYLSQSRLERSPIKMGAWIFFSSRGEQKADFFKRGFWTLKNEGPRRPKI